MILPNGYDEADFDRSLKVYEDKWTISYTGTFAADYSMDGFTGHEGLPPEKRSKVRVQFIGKRDEISEKRLIQLREQTGVKLFSKATFPTQRRWLPCNNLMLCYWVFPIGKQQGDSDGKIFEYLGSKRPILGVGPVDGDAAEIISQTQARRFLTTPILKG